MISFQLLKETYDTVSKAITRGQEPSDELKILIIFLREIGRDNAALLLASIKAGMNKEGESEGLMSGDMVRWVLEDMSPALLKKMCRERSRDQSVSRSQQLQYLDICGEVMEEYMKLMMAVLKQGYFNHDFLLGCKQIFDYDMMFHQYSFLIPDETIQRLFTKGTGQTWRHTLAEGDMVDALWHYIDKQGNSKCSGWSQAKILKVEGDSLFIDFAKEPSEHSRAVDRWSVELAPFLSKTKEIWEFKQTLQEDSQVDVMDDTFKWLKGTIIKMYDVVEDGKTFPVAVVGMRIYTPNGQRKDDRGNFDGWSDRFDEKIPIYSPRIVPFNTLSSKQSQEDDQIDESLDDLLEPSEGQSRVWAVPRPRKCTSSKYLSFLNNFCDQGGFDLVLNIFQKQDLSDDPGQFNLCILAILVSALSLAAPIFHKDVIRDYGQRLIDVTKQRLLSAPDVALREVKSQHLEAIAKAIDVLNRRILPKSERLSQSELFKLEMSRLCLNSSYMGRRIQGIRDLNQIIKNQRINSSKLDARFLVNWMKSNGIFDILFNVKKTHQQLVQRCDEVLKVLLQQDALDLELLRQFWSLTKTDLKAEVFKIISVCSFYFKGEHLEFIFNNISSTPVERIEQDELNCLSELGKYSRERDFFEFNERVSSFFWEVVMSEQSRNLELIEECISKFKDMSKNWTPAYCLEIYKRLISEITNPNSQTVSCLRLLKVLIKEHHEKSVNTYFNSSNNGVYPADEQSSLISSDQSPSARFQPMMMSLVNDHNLIDCILQDLARYCDQANEEFKRQGILKSETPQLGKQFDRKNLVVGGSIYSHQVQIEERLEFLKYFAFTVEQYCISKNELGVIYDLLVTKSCLESDQSEFLSWCKSSCEQQTKISQILNLQEVGEFITKKVEAGEFDVKNLAPVGFAFLQHYFITVNEEMGNLERIQQFQQNQGGTNKYQPKWANSTSYTWNTQSQQEQGQSKVVLLRPPSELHEMNMIWTLLQECENNLVIPQVIDFIIKLHLNLSEDLQSNSQEYIRAFLYKCMDQLKDENQESHHEVAKGKKFVQILKSLINETEANGAGEVIPHSSLMKGEILTPFVIKNKATVRGGDLLVQTYNNTTLWELKKEIAHTLDHNPSMLSISIGQGASLRELKNTDNGRTVKALGLKGGEVLQVSKTLNDKNIINKPLLDQEGDLIPEARRIFSEWYHFFLTEDGKFTNESTAYFIQGCCGDLPSPHDNRIQSLFANYDSNKDGNLEEEEFIRFYHNCSTSDKVGTVRENLRAFNVRHDLKKWKDIKSHNSLPASELPRYFLSKQDDMFNVLFELLNSPDEYLADQTWELVQMLCTNLKIYKQVLDFDLAREGDKINWSKFFDKTHPYRLLYTLQIVQAVLDEGNSDQQRAITMNFKCFPYSRLMYLKKKLNLDLPWLETEEAGEKCKDIETIEDYSDLREEWAEKFINMGGFDYIVNELLSFDSNQLDSSSEQNHIKYLAFLVSLLRNFIVEAIAGTDQNAKQVAKLSRRQSSSYNDGQDKINDKTDQKQSHIARVLSGPLGRDMLDTIDFQRIQKKTLELVHRILDKKTLVFEDKLVVENALILWLSCLTYHHELFNSFISESINEESAERFILKGILFCKYQTIREYFKDSLSNICNQTLSKSDHLSEKPLFFMIRILTQNFKLISQYPSRQYFHLYCDLLDSYFQMTKLNQLTEGDTPINLESILSDVIDRISEENKNSLMIKKTSKDAKEAHEKLRESSELFNGLIQLAGKILDNSKPSSEETHEPDSTVKQNCELIEEIFTRFIFPSIFQKDELSDMHKLTMKEVMEQRNQEKQSSPDLDTKKNAYNMLGSLVQRDSRILTSFLQRCLVPLMANIQRIEQWNYVPPSASERNQEFVGLRNLGCICYMNSMLQQFFNIPAFRYNILCADDNQEENQTEYKNQLVDDNMLHQLQKLIANLETSNRSEFNPWEFCFSFKEFDGMPTNTAEQKDAQEFLNLLFDRLENALKETPRKYLLQSVFGGKTCSQLVCKECGKVKNRIEDYYNLSLTVKGIKGMQESLSKMVEGEIINDYECSGCKKKVDITKRTLISQTPNVLIVHLQRIIFDFDTFQNEKINDLFEFPQNLDLRPYSYYEIMNRENRIKENLKGDAQNEEEEPTPVKEDETVRKEKEEEEENPEPEEEQCFEYRLAGVTVHSGSANAGHYWSYIDTLRQKDYSKEDQHEEKEFVENEQEKWMEFNDSIVRDFNLVKLREECFGGDQTTSTYTGFGISTLEGWTFNSGSYGKSGYMLFYEKKKKKPLKIVKGVENGQEQILEVDYNQCVMSSDLPNRIFQKVIEDNLKFTFENDIYTKEFFDFNLRIQKSILLLDYSPQNQALYEQGLLLASKSTLEILAKTYNNINLNDHIKVLASFFRSDFSCHLANLFLQTWCDRDHFAYLLDLLLECPDQRARTYIAMVVKYVVIQLREHDKHELEKIETFTAEGANGQPFTLNRMKSLCSRFMLCVMANLNYKAARNWSRFDQFLDVIYYFACCNLSDVESTIFSDVELESMPPLPAEYRCESKVGLEHLFINKYIDKNIDFMLGKRSPFFGRNIQRPDIGGPYTQANLSNSVKVLVAMLTDQEMLEKYPLTYIQKELILNKELIRVVLSSGIECKRFGSVIAQLCKDDEETSRKICKVFLRQIQQANLSQTVGYLKALKVFLKVQDPVKPLKLEWIFGLPDLLQKKNFNDTHFKFGAEFITKISEEIITFGSPLLQGSQDEALLAQIIRCKGRNDIHCISCLRELLGLMAKDRDVAEFIFRQPAHTFQYSRFVDWFKPYLRSELAISNKSSDYYQSSKVELIEKSLAYLETLEPVFAELLQNEKALLGSIKDSNPEWHSDLERHWAGFYNPDVLQRYPPQVILGTQLDKVEMVYVNDTHELIKVMGYQFSCDFGYSAPTGLFNLQLPHIPRRMNVAQTQTYRQYLVQQKMRESSQDNQDSDDNTDEPEGYNHDEVETQVEDRSIEWKKNKRTGPMIIKFALENKTNDRDLKVWIRILPKEGKSLNFEVTHSKRKAYLSKGTTRIAMTLVKIDPTKPFFENQQDIEFEMKIIVRSQGAGGAAPSIQTQNNLQFSEETKNTRDAGGEADSENEFEKEDRDGQIQYYPDQYQPQESKQEYQEMIQMYDLIKYKANSDSKEDGEKSEGMNSTEAIQNEEQGEAQGGFVSENEDGGRLDEQKCVECGTTVIGDDFNCQQCGSYVGSKEIQ